MKALLLLSICIPFAFSSLNKIFYEFIEENFNKEMADRLNRADLGEGGSFGGGGRRCSDVARRSILERNAVIFVHGEGESAETYKKHRQQFLDRGFNESELYATTYGSGKYEDREKNGMKCEYVKQVRDMIEAVYKYTNFKVSIIAYSMGSPIARKAILGGDCVDSGWQPLGDRLTDRVSLFLSVAGANRGYSLCSTFAIGICNKDNGLACGSKFLNDINSNGRYEGDFVASIYSNKDDVVGYKACNDKILSRIEAAQLNDEYEDKTHKQLIDDTMETQFKMAFVSSPNPCET